MKPRPLIIPYPEILDDKIWKKEREKLFKGKNGWFRDTSYALSVAKKERTPTMFSIKE